MTAVAFTASGFKATGTPTARTIPDRLAEIKNVKDFGATGNGVTDDWAAITAAYNWTVSDIRGKIFFPPGTYLVSQPIIVSGSNFVITGVFGASTITGNFADYVLKRDSLAFTVDKGSVIENLTVVNLHATGGGIVMAAGDGAIRNCKVTANQAISNFAGEASAFDFSIENCVVSPGSNVAGSNGVLAVACGPIQNCRIVGFETGMRFWGNEGSMYVHGCYFERNITGIRFGDASNVGGCSNVTVAGCWFKDNGTAIRFGPAGGPGSGQFIGLRIEASELVTVDGGRPQYGIYIASEKASACLFSGIIVTGQYDQYGIFVESHAGMPNFSYNQLIGVRSFNTSNFGGVAWSLPTTSVSGQFIECNSMPVYTMANITEQFEGDSYNVSDSNSATWGATAAGSGSTHAKVRWNGSAWSVVGK